MKLIIEQSMENAEPEITIRCRLMDDRLRRLIEQIRLYAFSIAGQRGGERYSVSLEDILYFESVEDKTFLYREDDVLECSFRLAELEAQLEGASFVRVSKACLLNLNCLDRVRPQSDGKLEAVLQNGERVMINRHYVKAFKEKLGL